MEVSSRGQRVEKEDFGGEEQERQREMQTGILMFKHSIRKAVIYPKLASWLEYEYCMSNRSSPILIYTSEPPWDLLKERRRVGY